MRQLSFDELNITTSRIRLRETTTSYFPDRPQVSNPDDLCRIMWREVFADRANEVFVVGLLNTNNILQSLVVVSEGGLASSIVEPRSVFQAALLDNAASLVAAHNHPSGNPEPSRQDIRITRQLSEAGKLLSIPMHDHLIITGEHSYTSLAQRGVIAHS